MSVSGSSRPAGSACVYTTGWPSWVHIENFSAWHNVPIGTKQNGMGGLDTGLHVQLAAARAPHRDARRPGQEGPVYLRRPHEPGATRGSASGECAMFRPVAGA